MKNVLMLTNIYPTNNPSYEGTAVCHFFTKEWVKMGYNVRVVHFESRFPSLFYKIAKVFQQAIMAKTGCVVDLDTPTKAEEYRVDNVPVLHVPIKKFIPHKRVSQKEMKQAINEVVLYLNREGFVPDAITAHFAQPQLEALHLLKQYYPDARTCMVFHSAGETIPNIYNNYLDYFASVDCWGFRSVAFMKQFESIYGKKPHEFLCYSGIPSKYLTVKKKEFPNGIHRFSYVGSLYKLKRVEDTIDALHLCYGENDYLFNIVGCGSEYSNLQKKIQRMNVGDKVKLLGKMERDIAQDIVAESDCFVMVSTHEAFGLVYLEAMAKGCITIATKGQGIDGIIVDGENGFLCEAKNPQALSLIFKRINSLPPLKLQEISEKAQETARQMTNKKVAEKYIDSIFQITVQKE